MYQETAAHLDITQITNNPYHLSYSDDTDQIDLYQSDHYTVADARSSDQEYLWYQNILYLNHGGQLYWRASKWDELQPDDLMASAESYSLELLNRNDGVLTFKHIPMAGDTPYLLKAEYPLSEVKQETRKVYPTLMIRMDEDKKITSFSVSWSSPAFFSNDETIQNGGDMFSLTYYLDAPEDAFLQAERRVWSFGQEFGLTQEVVPALTTQQEKREWCKKIIAGMNFEGLTAQAIHSGHITFPTIFPNTN